MKHELIAKFEALTNLANENRSIGNTVATERKLTHHAFLIEMMYGVSYMDDDLNMYCMHKKHANADRCYSRIPLSEFSTEDQTYYRELYHSYITINKEINDLKAVMKDVLIGLTVIRMGNEDEATEDEEVIIEDLKFCEGLSFMVYSKTRLYVIPHEKFK